MIEIAKESKNNEIIIGQGLGFTRWKELEYFFINEFH